MLAFIPARAGSVGVIGKNWRKLNGKPLVMYSVEFAMRHDIFEQVIVSTNSPEVATLATNGLISEKDFHEIERDEYLEIDKKLVLHRRKDSQAETLSPIRDVLFELSTKRLFDSVCMLQPTSPFRNESELFEIRSMLEEPNWTSIASFTPVGGMHPDRMYRLGVDKFLQPYVDQKNLDNKPRQLLENLFIKDGAYYVFRHKLLLEKILMGSKVRPIYRQGLCTVNIDTETDFQIAELVSRNSMLPDALD